MATPTETFIQTLSDTRAWWPLDDADPTDERVNGLDLTFFNTPTTGIDMGFTAGDTGVQFAAASNQYASRAHDNAFNAGLGDWSVAFWAIIPSSDATTRYIIGHDGNGDAGSWDIKHVNSLMQTRFAGITPGNSSFTPNSTVKFWVYNFDRDSNAVRYLDGVSNHSASISSGSAVDVSVSKILYLARRETAGGGDVTLCHVIFRAALWTPTEISDAMAARLASANVDASAGNTAVSVGAHDARVMVQPRAGVAAVSIWTSEGFGSDADVEPGVATATAAANQAAAKDAVPAQSAATTAAAHDAATGQSGSTVAGVASAAADARTPAPRIASPAGPADATAAALGAAPAMGIASAVASPNATVEAHDATISAAPATWADAEAADVAAAAHDPGSSATTDAGVAIAAFGAHDAGVSITTSNATFASAGLAAVGVTAQVPTTRIAIRAGVAAISWVARGTRPTFTWVGVGVTIETIPGPRATITPIRGPQARITPIRGPEATIT